MKILITGAHFTPAAATIEELKKYKDCRIVYVGRGTTREGDPSPSIESQVLPKMGVKFIPIITGRLQRPLSLHTIPSLLKIPIGFIQAFYIILVEKPDVILSFGGYVAVPLVIAGWFLSVPIIIHEQSLVSGLTNKISSAFADKIAVSFKGEDQFNKPTVLTGNPLRASILESANLRYPRKEKLPTILITGGNQGSHLINISVEACLAKLKKIACIIHITGDSKFKDFERLEKLQDNNYSVKKWIDGEYGAILQKVDLVVSRAGINTLTELAYLGKPALVVPIPYLFADEQSVNAKFFENLGLVKILPQSKLSGKSLLENIKFMLSDIRNLNKQAKGVKTIIIPDAAKRLALETMLLLKK